MLGFETLHRRSLSVMAQVSCGVAWLVFVCGLGLLLLAPGVEEVAGSSYEYEG